MKYAIIENEYHCMEHLKNMLQDLRPDWELVFRGETVEETINMLAGEQLPELIFMDIELNDGNSFSIFKKTKVDIPIIFTTAYDEYCLQAFKVNSIDYLLKPITINSLLYAIRKYENLKNTRGGGLPISEKLPIHPESSIPRLDVRILISYRDTYKFITADSIAWFESEDKCVFAIDKGGDRHLTTFSTLNEVEVLLPSKHFFRASRSCIVSIDVITDVKKAFNYKLYIVVKAAQKTQKIDISMAKKKEFLSWFGHGKV